MGKLANGREIERALRSVNVELRAALKEINLQAGKLLAKGRYEEAERLVASAKSVGLFHADFEQLRARWKALKSSAGGSDEQRSALWEFYQPIIAALTKLGGTADGKDIEAELEPLVRARMKPGDLQPNARGIPRWRIMLRRARRPMADEGLLEKRGGKVWHLAADTRPNANRRESAMKSLADETSTK